MTCHNRKANTLRCLDRLFRQRGLDDVTLEVFLVDDGSTDGTAEAIKSTYPAVHLLRGDGSLFWSGGMRMAMDAARGGGFDHYLWLNDDTMLYPDALGRLLRTYAKLAAYSKSPLVVVGSLRDPESGKLSYGGSVRTCWWHPLRFAHIEPADEPVICAVFNGNCLLVPADAAERLGNLHPRLVHSGGDYEYGLRAEKKHVARWIAPGYFGECPRNPIADTWMDASMSLRQRYRALFSPKGQPPMPRLIVYSHYGGPFWIVLYPLIYLRPLATSIKLFFSK
jgi:GT2 family glycosyltransferase